MARMTVLGAGGFIGSHLARRLAQAGHEVDTPAREADIADRDLGRVAYCIGLTADFRQRPLETMEAHVCRLLAVLHHCRFESLVYLSSTRVYGSGNGSGLEDAPVSANPNDPSDLYNLSKLAGESLCLHSGRPARIARLSNVYGADFASQNFLAELIRAAVDDGEVVLRSDLASAKDYISLDETLDALCWMLNGPCAHGVYNVASGQNTTNAEIVDALVRATGCALRVEPGAPQFIFPTISVARLHAEYSRPAQPLTAAVAGLVSLYSQTRSPQA
jgi:nucleoside-diphosphate-sugar epimerase